MSLPSLESLTLYLRASSHAEITRSEFEDLTKSLLLSVPGTVLPPEELFAMFKKIPYYHLEVSILALLDCHIISALSLPRPGLLLPLPNETSIIQPALSTPSPANSTSIDATSVGAMNGTIHCEILPMMEWHCCNWLWWPYCEKAIQALPSSDLIATFHTGGIDDGFRLPVQRNFKSCQVQVRLSDAGGVVSETGSWDGVRLNALQLGEECRTVPSFAWAWGFTRSGWEGDIFVHLVLSQ